jgi:hypothetical protein
MRWLIIIFVSIATVSCTVTITPIAKKPVRHKYVKHSTKYKTASAHKNQWLIVDSDWLVQYRQLEEDHGNYRLMDDAKVEAVGGGKYKVTHAMMDHFRDLTQAPPK